MRKLQGKGEKVAGEGSESDRGRSESGRGGVRK